MGNTQYIHMVGRPGRVRLAWETHYPGAVRTIHNTVLETYLLKSMDAMWEESMEHMLFRKKGDLWYLMTHGEGITRVIPPSVQGFHKIIVCLGLTFDRSIFDASAMPDATKHKGYESKFPILNSRFEASNVSHMFFLGSPMHSNDYKHAAGGFIHGFRYTCPPLMAQSTPKRPPLMT